MQRNETVAMTTDWISLREQRLGRLELFEIGAAPGVGADNASDRCIFLRVEIGNYAGWGTCLIAEESVRFDIVSWASYLHRIKPLTLEEGFLEAERQRDVWGSCKTELVLEALLQLESRSRSGLVSPSAPADTDAVMRRATAYYNVLF